MTWKCKKCRLEYHKSIKTCPKCNPSKATLTATEAMQFAVIAISQLERIRKNDPKREEALNRVVAWIETQKQI